MAFELPDLPYAHDALAAGGMSEETLQFHHDIHHLAYVNKANEMIAGTAHEGKSLEEVMVAAFKNGETGLMNQTTQIWNHNQFWGWMKPNGGGAMPSELENRIKGAFGSVEDFKKAFVGGGAGQFGSGWVWLALDKGELEIVATPNGVNPECLGKTSLLGVDVWEHSYYIDFRNKRPVYIENFLEKLVNWEDVAARLTAAGAA